MTRNKKKVVKEDEDDTNGDDEEAQTIDKVETTVQFPQPLDDDLSCAARAKLHYDVCCEVLLNLVFAIFLVTLGILTGKILCMREYI